jgi:hypothetical protein
VPIIIQTPKNVQKDEDFKKIETAVEPKDNIS